MASWEHEHAKRTLEEVVDDVVGLETGGPRAYVADGVKDALLVHDRENLRSHKTTHQLLALPDARPLRPRSGPKKARRD